jgi:hypothetical protein
VQFRNKYKLLARLFTSKFICHWQTVVNRTQVSSEPRMGQIDNSALGRIPASAAVTGLSLVTRNFVQGASLSPGVISQGVQNTAGK